VDKLGGLGFHNCAFIDFLTIMAPLIFLALLPFLLIALCLFCPPAGLIPLAITIKYAVRNEQKRLKATYRI